MSPLEPLPIAANKPTEVLPDGRVMENFGAPKHRPPPGHHHHSPPIHFGLDVRRKSEGIHQEGLPLPSLHE